MENEYESLSVHHSSPIHVLTMRNNVVTNDHTLKDDIAQLAAGVDNLTSPPLVHSFGTFEGWYTMGVEWGL
jgi:hypothetical protein